MHECFYARVFLLQNDLEYSKKYTNETDINSLIGEEVGQALFNKDLASDTIWLKSKLDVGKYIVNGSKQDFNSGADFVNFFKGLYVRTDDVNGSEGAIYEIGVYNASYIKLYYKDKKTLESGKDTIYTPSPIYFPITDNSARFNLPVFNHKEQIKANDKIYLQGIHGTMAKVEMPDLNNWKNYTNISVNNAKLVFTVATSEEEAKKYPLPQRLSLAVVDTNGKRTFLNYATSAGMKLSGLLDSKERTYAFYIPEYLQKVVDGKVNFDHFELSIGGVELRPEVQSGGKRFVFYPLDSKNIPARVVLHNKGEHKPKLKVTYTKY